MIAVVAFTSNPAFTSSLSSSSGPARRADEVGTSRMRWSQPKGSAFLMATSGIRWVVRDTMSVPPGARTRLSSRSDASMSATVSKWSSVDVETDAVERAVLVEGARARRNT